MECASLDRGVEDFVSGGKGRQPHTRIGVQVALFHILLPGLLLPFTVPAKAFFPEFLLTVLEVGFEILEVFDSLFSEMVKQGPSVRGLEVPVSDLVPDVLRTSLVPVTIELGKDPSVFRAVSNRLEVFLGQVVASLNYLGVVIADSKCTA